MRTFAPHDIAITFKPLMGALFLGATVARAYTRGRYPGAIVRSRCPGGEYPREGTDVLPTGSIDAHNVVDNFKKLTTDGCQRTMDCQFDIAEVGSHNTLPAQQVVCPALQQCCYTVRRKSKHLLSRVSICVALLLCSRCSVVCLSVSLQQ